MIIPSSFQLLGQTIEVVIDNKYCWKNDSIYGIYIPHDNKIILATKYKTEKGWRKYKQEIIESTLYHELAHCLLLHTSYEDLWLDERLVNLLGNLFHQFEKTKITV
jgi:5-methylcytosine-specific restriction endonuclease McrBC regulatory subunit McrC